MVWQHRAAADRRFLCYRFSIIIPKKPYKIPKWNYNINNSVLEIKEQLMKMEMPEPLA